MSAARRGEVLIFLPPSTSSAGQSASVRHLVSETCLQIVISVEMLSLSMVGLPVAETCPGME